ncbi:hypothetical protein VTO73DRAFT_3326 [Trametes versicolor]
MSLSRSSRRCVNPAFRPSPSCSMLACGICYIHPLCNASLLSYLYPVSLECLPLRHLSHDSRSPHLRCLVLSSLLS